MLQTIPITLTISIVLGVVYGTLHGLPVNLEYLSITNIFVSILKTTLLLEIFSCIYFSLIFLFTDIEVYEYVNIDEISNSLLYGKYAI